MNRQLRLLLIRSTIIGAVSAVALGVLAFALNAFFDAGPGPLEPVGVYIAPFRLLSPILDRIPLTLVNMVDRLLPIDGPAAGVGLILVGVLSFWTVSFAALYFAWATWRRKRAIQRTRQT
jgi:hypothetical protein